MVKSDPRLLWFSIKHVSDTNGTGAANSHNEARPMSDLCLFLDCWVRQAFEGVLEEVDECGGQYDAYVHHNKLRLCIRKMFHDSDTHQSQSACL